MVAPAPPDATRAVLGTVLGTIRLALADRALIWAALMGALWFTAWAMLRPEPWRLAAAAGYAAMVWWPLLFREHTRRPTHG